ncbi:hypothetical protein [Haladaptatus sp. NG-SE-30]
MSTSHIESPSHSNTHLPKLEEVGLVHYDRTTGTVELDSVSPQFERYLEYAAENEELARRVDGDHTNDGHDTNNRNDVSV